MADRNLRTSRIQVFGDAQKGTECRVCGRDVEDGRAKFCSDYCRDLCAAVMDLLNWSSLREIVIERDDETCQVCGYDYALERQARHHIRDLVQEQLGDRPKGPSALDLGKDEAEDFDWDAHHEELEAWRERRAALKGRYGDWNEQSRRLEVDHITPISDGGHPFDPGNLQTLCEDCHQDKTSQEHSDRAEALSPSRGELSESLLDYITDGEEMCLTADGGDETDG